MSQVDNPVSVLNQDTSRNFLNSSDPKDKYKVGVFELVQVIVDLFDLKKRGHKFVAQYSTIFFSCLLVFPESHPTGANEYRLSADY